MKKFKVKFTELKKYNPVTRQVEVQTTDERSAIILVGREFGSFNKKGELQKITINEIIPL